MPSDISTLTRIQVGNLGYVPSVRTSIAHGKEKLGNLQLENICHKYYLNMIILNSLKLIFPEL